MSTPRKLNRFPDPILVEGKWLPRLLGAEIASLRLHVFENGGFRPIRFQVDERTDEGDWIFPQGSRNNGHRSNGRLDPQDVVLFMAKDAGEQAPDSAVLPGAVSVTPIELTDPLDGLKAWVYLASHREPVPSPCPLPDYVHYDHEQARIRSLCLDQEFIISEDGLHTSNFRRLATPVSGGGSGENFLDRAKTRAEVRLFFDLVPIQVTEESQNSDIVAYIGGPIRCMRRQSQFVKLPFGARAFRSCVDLANYESVAIVPVEMRSPKGVHRIVSSARIQLGTDYAPSAMGSYFRNSANPEPLIIDGRMSEAEKRFNTDNAAWKTFHGPHGALFSRATFPSELLDGVEISQRYVDDLHAALPPERFSGSLGFSPTEVLNTEIKPGVYRFVLDVGYPAFFEPGDERMYLNMRDHPVRIRIGEKEVSNPLDLRAEVGEDF